MPAFSRTRRRQPLLTHCVRTVAMALMVQVAAGYASGYYFCLDQLQSPHTTQVQLGPGSYAIQLLQAGTAVSSYTGGQTYTVTLTGSSFTGMLIVPYASTAVNLGTAFAETPTAGQMSPINGQTAQACSAGLTQTSSARKTTISGSWTAPDVGTGPVTFGAFVVVTTSSTYRVYLEVQEDSVVSPTPSNTPVPTPTPTISPPVTPSLSRTPSKTPTATASRSSTVTASMTRTSSNTNSMTRTGSVTGSPTLSASPPMTPGASYSSSASVPPTGSTTGSGSASTSGSSSASPSLTATLTASRTTTASSSPTRSAAATKTATLSGTMTVSGTTTRSITHSRTGSQSATSSSWPTPSSGGAGGSSAPLPSVYRYSVRFDAVMSMYWTPRAAAGVIDYLVVTKGRRYLSVAPATAGVTMLDGGAAIVGTTDNLHVSTCYMRSYLLSELPLGPTDGVLTATGVAYDSATDTSSLWYTHTVGPASTSATASGDVDLTGHLASPVDFLWAYGPLGAPWSMHVACGTTAVVLDPSACTRSGSCSGHGDCGATGACVCDAGWGGSSCSGCTPPYSRAATGGCEILDRTLAGSGLALIVTLPLDLGVGGGVSPAPSGTGSPANGTGSSSHGSGDSTGGGAALPAVTCSQFAADAAAAASLPVAQVTCVNLHLDGPAPNVTLAFSPPVAGALAIAANASSDSSLVASGVAALQAALANNASALLAAPAGQYFARGARTAAVLARGDPNPAPAPLAPIYSAPLLLRDGEALTLSWVVDKAGGWLVGELNFGGDSWFGIGFSAGSSTAMVTADALACEPGAPGLSLVTQYTLAGYTAASCPAAAGSPLLDTPSSLMYRSPHAGWTCRFRRRLVSAAPVELGAAAGGGMLTPRAIDGSAGLSVVITSAHGPPDVHVMGTHSTRESGAVVVNLETGSWWVPPQGAWASPVFVAHAAAGGVALAVVMPASVIVARYYKGVGNPGVLLQPEFTVWYRIHALLGLLAAVGTVIAWAMGAAAVTSAAPRTVHGVLGLASAALVTALVVLSQRICLRPAATASPQKRQDASGSRGVADDGSAPRRTRVVVHAVAGVALLLLGVATVLSGLFAAGADTAVADTLAAYGFWLALLLIVVVGHEVGRRRETTAKSDAVSGMPAARSSVVSSRVEAAPAALPIAPSVIQVRNPYAASKKLRQAGDLKAFSTTKRLAIASEEASSPAVGFLRRQQGNSDRRIGFGTHQAVGTVADA